MFTHVINIPAVKSRVIEFFTSLGAACDALGQHGNLVDRAAADHVDASISRSSKKSARRYDESTPAHRGSLVHATIGAVSPNDAPNEAHTTILRVASARRSSFAETHCWGRTSS